MTSTYYDTGYFETAKETDSNRTKATDLFVNYNASLHDNENNEFSLAINKIPLVYIDSISTEEININHVDYRENDMMLTFKDSPSKTLGKKGARHDTGLTINYLPSKVDKRVIINVSGIRYETYFNTLKLLPNSRLANLNESNADYDPIKKEYFFDRHPGAFLSILTFFRTGKLHVPADLCANAFSDELSFWEIDERFFAPCCWSKYSTNKDVDSILKKILEKDQLEKEKVETEESDVEDLSAINISRNKLRKKSSLKRRPNRLSRLHILCGSFHKRIKNRIWRFLNDRKSSLAAHIYFWISVIILLSSIINFVLETSSYFRVPYQVSTNTTLTRAEREAQTQVHFVLRSTEIFCNGFFTAELLLKFLSSPNKLQFLLQPYTTIEFLSIFPIFFPPERPGFERNWANTLHNYLEVLYILRILRIFVLVPKYSGLRVLLLTLKVGIADFVLYLMLLILAVLIFATFVFYGEQIYERDNNPFESIIISIYWAVVTITTLGYGDIAPQTPQGRIIACICALCGLVFLALPIPVIVNNFTSFYAYAKGYQKLSTNYLECKALDNLAKILQVCSKPQTIKKEIDENGNEIIKVEENNGDTENYSKMMLRNNFEIQIVESNLSISKINEEKSKQLQNANKIKDLFAIKAWKQCERQNRRNALVDLEIDKNFGSIATLKK